MIHPPIGALSQARDRTDRLFELVPRQLFYARPIPERHRIAFYLGHLEAFDVNLLGRERAAAQPAHALDHLFAFGIDPEADERPDDEPEDWPPLTEICRYAEDARRRVDRILAETPDHRTGGYSLATLLNVAIEHRLMHAETLAYIFNQLDFEKPLRAGPATDRNIGDDDTVVVPAGTTTLGLSREEDTFGWDNEFQAHVVEVPAFEINRYMVSNAQFLRFMEAGGYTDPRWWTLEDWQWRVSRSVTHPRSWRFVQGQWRHLSCSDEIPFQGDWPVYVSHAEASAYAKWAGRELPTEAQWHRAAYGDPAGAERRYPWGDETPTTRHGNFDFARWDPLPVDAHPQGESAFGVAGLLGNGWEWTRTPFGPFPGFQPFAFYRGYSADFFDARHFVLKGGSAHTALPLLRRSFRNWFRPHYPYPFAGFRCVRPA